MLYTETVEPGTLSILKELIAVDALQEFSLVGGTALSLKFGHRTSVDLDLFSHQKFEADELKNALIKSFGKSISFETTNPFFGIFCYIDEVKIDIVKYPHQLIASIGVEDGIRMYDNADIAAMKIQAILGRGRKKDFWDLAELLKHYSLRQIITWHSAKFPSQELFISIPQAVTYFADAEESEEPVSLKGQTWPGIKKTISKAVSDYLK